MTTMKNIHIARQLLEAVRNTPDSKFDYKQFPLDPVSDECGCALHVLGKLGYVDDNHGNLAPFEAGEIFNLDDEIAAYLFNNSQRNWGNLTDQQLRGVLGKVEFELRWIEVFGTDNLPFTESDVVSIGT